MELKRAFIETKIQEWNDLFLLNQKFMSNFIFRGQANSEWSLRTSLERLIENHHPTPSRDKALYYIYESEMIKEFKWKFPSYEKNLIPKDGELIEWLSIMQHFGAPTRLLDFPCPCMLLFLWQWIIPFMIIFLSGVFSVRCLRYLQRSRQIVRDGTVGE